MADKKHLAIRQIQASEAIAERIGAIEELLTAPGASVASELIMSGEPLATAAQVAALSAQIDTMAAQLAQIIAAIPAPESAPPAELTAPVEA